MRKAGLITIALVASTLFMSCSSSKSASNGYLGVNNKKATKQQQKEFQKPKHKIKKSKALKTGR